MNDVPAKLRSQLNQSSSMQWWQKYLLLRTTQNVYKIERHWYEQGSFPTQLQLPPNVIYFASKMHPMNSIEFCEL